MSCRCLWRACCIVALATQAACFQAVMHGPRVEKGLSGFAGASVTRGPTHTEGDEGGIRLRNAPIGLGVGYGWRGATRHEASLFTGLYVPIAFPFAQLDLFAQAPEAWTGATMGGAGMNVAIDHVAPYLQWGRVNDRGSGWSLIQGVSMRTDDEHSLRQLTWTPGLAAHIGGSRSRVHLYAMGAFGRIRRSCVATSECGTRTWALQTGLTLELLLRKRDGA